MTGPFHVRVLGTPAMGPQRPIYVSLASLLETLVTVAPAIASVRVLSAPSVRLAEMPDQQVDRELDRQGRRLGRPGQWLILLAVLLAAPGLLLLVVGSGPTHGVGIVLVSLAGAPALVGLGLLLANAVAWWSARDKPFA